MTRGRRPGDPRLIDACDGTELAKERSKIILSQMLGRMSVEEAAAALGVCPSRLHKLRHTGMQGLVGACEPKKTGRPSSQAERDPEAAAEIARLQHELATEKRERLADQIRFELRLQEARKPGKRR